MPTRTRETTRIPAQMKALDPTKGLFEGYLAVFNNTDLNGDIIEPGAFTKTLQLAYEIKTANKAQFLFPLLWMHDTHDPVGGFTDATQDRTGLYVKGLCDMDTEQGRRAFSGMTKGYMAQMSIGYDTIRATRDQTGVRHLLEVGLWEGSVVTTGYAANPQAVITATKIRDPRNAALAAARALTQERSIAAVDALLAHFANGIRNPVTPSGLRLTGYLAKRYDVMQAIECERAHDLRPSDGASLALRAGWQTRETLRRAEEARWA